MEHMNFSWVLKGLVRREGEGIPSQARWKNHLNKKKA